MSLTKDQVKESEPAFVCDLTALEPEQRKQHQITTEQLFATITEIQELSQGYAFRLAEEPDILARVAEFIKYERLCCPFLSFALEVEPQRGALWLKLTGAEGVKPFLQFEFNLDNKVLS